MPKPIFKIKSFQLHEGKTSTKQIGILLIVALFFIGLVWLGGWAVKENIEESGNVDINTNTNTSKNVTGTFSEDIVVPDITPVIAEENSIPDGFPEDIPLNGKMNIVEAESSKSTETGKITGSHLVFQSKNTLAENQTFYENWARDNKWQMSSEAPEVVEENVATIIINLTKENAALTISLEELLYDTTKITMDYRINTSVDKEKLIEALKGIKL